MDGSWTEAGRNLFAATGCTGLLDLLALDGQASSGGIRSHELDFSESSRRGGRGMLHALVMHCGCGGPEAEGGH